MPLPLKEGIKQPKRVNICIQVNPFLIQDKTPEEQQQAINEGLIIRGYINGDLSMGEVAETLGLKYEEALAWLAKRGIATWQELPIDVEEITEKNMRELARELSIKLPE